jgi:hypothetical protein
MGYRRAAECHLFVAAGELGEDDLALDPGHRCADAGVYADAEPDVSAGASGDVEAVRVWPPAVVAVGRAEEQQHLRACRDAFVQQGVLVRVMR